MSNAPQYITGNWSHIFEGERSERMTRVVLDATTRKVLALQIQRNRAVTDSYGLSTRTELLDVEDSMVNANQELFDDPGAFDLELTDSMPDWASSQIEESALRMELAELQGKFAAAGGRGVELAEQIDAIQRQLGEYEGDEQ
ncbi:hypothetical protein CJU35_05425 [Pseudomonas aeruginosa]|nr:hypothetical protein [Pseudomonas aeruginosa]PBV09294.1 hypothetical protein CJU35_05425 [Pseudomonas aeruginosa]